MADRQQKRGEDQSEMAARHPSTKGWGDRDGHKRCSEQRRETKNKMETGVKGSQREMSTLQYQHTHIKLQRLEFKYKDYEYVNDSNDHSGL